MSRSAKDATRFTATIPHAYSKPTSRVPNPRIASRSPTGPNPTETPQQKVARLRAEHEARKAADFSTWDRIVVRGRLIADSAHRVTVMGLIGLTVLAGGVTLFSLGDMIMYNRRKRKIYFEEQTQLRQERIVEAEAAAAAGTLNEDQILLLNQEQAKRESAEAKKSQPGFFKRTFGTVFGTENLKKEDVGTIKSAEGNVEQRIQEVKVEANQSAESLKDRPTTSTIIDAVESKRRQGEKELQKRGIEGGALDHIADEAATAAAKKGKSWTSWMTRS